MKKLLFVVVFASVAVFAKAQLSQFQAMYLYNFAKNIGWPTEDAGSDFVITVIGDKAVEQEMAKMAKVRKVGTRSIIVKGASNVAEVTDSDIIFLGESKSGHISRLVEAQKGNKVLIVTGRKGLCQDGAGVSFALNYAGKLGFEISQGNIEQQGLSVAQKLVNLGTQVN